MNNMPPEGMQSSLSSQRQFHPRKLLDIHHPCLAHAFYMEGNYLKSIVAFAVMRPVHSSYLLAFGLTHALLDPHDFGRVVLAVRDVSKAMAALVSYVGALTVLSGCDILLWQVVPLFWRYLTLQLTLLLALMVSRVLFWNGTKLVAGFLLSMVRKLYGVSVAIPSSTPAQLIKEHGLVIASKLRFVLKYLATTWLLRPLLGPPPSELPLFTLNPIDPTKQIRLLEIQPRIPFTTPASRLFVYSLEDPPPFEAVSLVVPLSSSTEPTQININNRQYPTSVSTRDTITKLSCLFQTRLVWIKEICLDSNLDLDIHRKPPLPNSWEIDHRNLALKKSFRVQVPLGSAPLAHSAVAFMNTLTGLSWTSGLQDGVGYYERVCCATRSVIEEGLISAFLEFLNHPWWGDADTVREVLGCKQVTFIYGNCLVTADYLAYVGEVLANAEEGFTRTAVERAGEGEGKELSWPLPESEVLIGLSRSRDVFDMGDWQDL